MKWCRIHQWLCFLQLVVLLLCSNNSLGNSDHNVEESCLASDGSSSSSEECKGGASASQLDNNPGDITRSNEFQDFGDDMGVSQTFGVQEQETVWPVLAKARQYLQDVVFQEPQYEPIRSRCKNKHDSCAFWVTLGQCETNPSYMFQFCAPVCLACDYFLTTLDAEEKLQQPSGDEPSMQEQVYYGEDIGVKQHIPGHLQSKVQDVIRAARDYVHHVIHPEPRYDELVEVCKNMDASCAHLAVLGECRNNARYMNLTCGPVCQSCEYRLTEVRCPLDPNAIDAFYPGDLDKMFERITTQPEYQQYEPKALSRPDLLPGDTEETAPYKLGGPWVVTLDNFLTVPEAKRMIELGAKIGYQRSGKQGHLKFDGTYETYYDEGRTSTSSWCADDCLTDPVVQAVTERITNLTGTPEPNLEFFQILKYEEGQFYQTHHDCMLHHLQRQEGLRVLTVYLYLNDVEEGGGTNFPTLDLTVMPKLGRVVIWPSVLNEDPNRDDNRTEHQALPVIKGVKYGTNVWVHMRDFKTPFANGCE